MKRKIIRIDEEKCNGCGLCAKACHEGAIVMTAGSHGPVAKLIRDDYCDGLGDCLPVCPTGAITFEEREAAAFDTEAVKAHMAARVVDGGCPSGGCPGSRAHAIARTPVAEAAPVETSESQLRQWPVQIKLAPVRAPYLDGAHLLIAADCAAYACGDFHRRFMAGKVTLIGCPKLDSGDYGEKLLEILRHNDIKSVTIARMEVPCCGGLQQAAVEALRNCGKMIPWHVVTLATDGRVPEG